MSVSNNKYIRGNLSVYGSIKSSDIDSLNASTLLLGKSQATKIEIADAGVITEVQGPLEVSDIDTSTAVTLQLGSSQATKLELGDTGVVTEIKGSLNVEDIDTATATTLTLGKSQATKIELADAGVITEVRGDLQASSLDASSGVPLVLGGTNASKLELGDTGVVTEIQGFIYGDFLDTITGTTLQLGSANATKVEIGDAGVITEIQGPLEVTQVDSVGAATLQLGSANATRVEIADVGVVTDIEGQLTVSGVSEFLDYLEFSNITAPSNPANGKGRLYKKTGNDGIFWLPDSGGAEVDLTDNGSAGGTIPLDYNYIEDENVSSTTSTAYSQLMRLTTSSLSGGDYKLSVSFNWSGSSSSKDLAFRCQVDDVTNWFYLCVHPDQTSTDPSSNSGEVNCGFRTLTLAAGVHNIDLDVKCQSGQTSYVSNMRLEVFRVA